MTDLGHVMCHAHINEDKNILHWTFVFSFELMFVINVNVMNSKMCEQGCFIFGNSAID